MLNPEERDYIFHHACIPEHIPEYVFAISGLEPYMVDDYIYYYKPDRLVFVGYPLHSDPDPSRLDELLRMLCRRLRLEQISLITPHPFHWQEPSAEQVSDHYYRLPAGLLPRSGKVLNMVRRASREVEVRVEDSLITDHIECIHHFLERKPLDEASRHLFSQVPHYVSSVATCKVFSARDSRGVLAAFTIGEFGSKQYAFYMFNFRSADKYVPGACDLLLYGLLDKAKEMGRGYLNMGLGIHRGIRSFKEKWEASAFLPYTHHQYRVGRPSFLKFLMRR